MRDNVVRWLVRNPRIGALTGATSDECQEAAQQLRACAAQRRERAKMAAAGRASDFNDDGGWDRIYDQERDADTADEDAALIETSPHLSTLSRIILSMYSQNDAPVGLSRRILQREGLTQSQAQTFMGVAREWERNECTWPDWAQFTIPGEGKAALRSLMEDSAIRAEMYQFAEKRDGLKGWLDEILS